MLTSETASPASTSEGTLSRGQGEYVIAPNDLIFLMNECSLCFWRKERLGLARPSTPFPGQYSQLAARQSDFFVGRTTQQLSAELPPGKVTVAKRWVKSEPIDVPGHRSKVVIRGRIDLALAFDNGDFGLADLKTSAPDSGLGAKYFPQVSLYSLALERPAPGQFGLLPVTRMGLLLLYPGRMSAAGDGFSIAFEPTWIEIQRDDAAAFQLLNDVLDIVEDPSAPVPSDRCKFCRYRSN